MKSLLFILLSSFPTFTMAQLNYTDCEKADYSIDVSNEALQQAYSGSICFNGSGEVAKSTNINDWTSIHFSTDDTMMVYMPVVFKNESKVFAQGSVRFSQIAMNGGDTLYVNSGVCQIDNIVCENADANRRNVIVVDEGAELFISGMPINPTFGDVVISTGAQKSNKLRIVAGTPQIIGMHR